MSAAPVLATPPSWQLLVGDVRAALAQLSARSVHCCVTSPPYWGLRAYGTEPQIWGGRDGCAHDWQTETRPGMTGGHGDASPCQSSDKRVGAMFGSITSATCTLCGAWRGELGSEAVPDCLGWATNAPCGQCFVCHLLEVFGGAATNTGVWRVLRDDGVCFVNLGDSYAGSGKGPSGGTGINSKKSYWSQDTSDVQRISQRLPSLGARIGSSHGESGHTSGVTPPRGWKSKDLMLMPARVALALQAAGWYVRSDIIWSKNNPMPESVTDRPTRSHEYIWLLSKRPRYYWDAEAVREPHTAGNTQRQLSPPKKQSDDPRVRTRPVYKVGEARYLNPAGRNLRSVWAIPTQSFRGAHFATWPERLVERMVRAGCPPRVCGACGQPWRRETQRKATPKDRATGRGWQAGIAEQDCWPSGTPTHSGLARAEYQARETLGWSPTCECAAPPVGGTLLDPFAGSGTSLVVALRHGRSAIGCELNPEYAAMAEARIIGDAPLFNAPGVAREA